MTTESPVNIADKNTFKILAKALEPLELEGRLRYLPAFECCGSCAGARLHDFMGIPGDDWGNYEFYVTFNEQTAENADYNCEIALNIGLFESQATYEKEAAAKLLIAEALIAGGFTEIQPPAKEHSSQVAYMNPNFRLNTFHRTRDGRITVLGRFDGKAKPTKAVRKRIKELKLNS